jgi:hypothetical protein
MPQGKWIVDGIFGTDIRHVAWDNSERKLILTMRRIDMGDPCPLKMYKRVKDWTSERAGRFRPLRDSYLSSSVCWAFDNIAADGRDHYVCTASQWRLGTTYMHLWNLIQSNGYISVLCSLSMMKKHRCWPHAIMKLGWIIHPLIILWFSAIGQVTVPLSGRPTWVWYYCQT